MMRALIVAFAGMLLLASPAMAQEAVGYWRGTLKLGEVSLRLGVKIERAADGALTGSVDSPDQNVFGLRIAQVTAGEGALALTMDAPQASYSAKWDSAAHAWNGAWRQGGGSWPLVLTAGEPFARAAPPPLPANWSVPTNAQLAGLIEERIAQRPGAGVVIGVIDAGGRRVVARGPAGAAPFDGDTVFEIGSMSKIFTSLILADMVLKGEVSLDDPAQKYLPAGATMPSRDGKVITLRNLSLQDSGLPRLPDNMPYADPQNPYADYTEADLLAFLSHYQLTRDPGSQYQYSNLGVGLLGYLLARAAHTDYATLLHERISGPLGMKDTVIALSPDQRKRFATPHDEYLRPTKPWDLSVLAGAGAIRSTANDMLRFLAAALDPHSRIAPEMKLLLSDRRKDDPQVQTALGWIVLPAPAGEVPMHNGGTGGFRSDMALQPATGRAVVALTNAAVAPAVDDLALHALVGSPVARAGPVPPLPSQHAEVALAPAQLDHVVGTYQLAPALRMTISRDGDHLTTQLTGQAALPIYPAGPLTFFLKIVDAQIRFVEEAGTVTGAVLTQNGRTTEAKKVE